MLGQRPQPERARSQTNSSSMTTATTSWMNPRRRRSRRSCTHWKSSEWTGLCPWSRQNEGGARRDGKLTVELEVKRVEDSWQERSRRSSSWMTCVHFRQDNNNNIDRRHCAEAKTSSVHCGGDECTLSRRRDRRSLREVAERIL